MADSGPVASVTPEEFAPIRRYIIANEGWHQSAYLDTAGIPTIGVGFNLLRSDARAKIEALGLDYDDVLNRKCALSDEQIENLLQQDVETAVAAAQGLVPAWEALSMARKKVLADLAFNVGAGGFAKFSRFLAAINRGDWLAAEAEIVNSLYYRQVGARGKRNAAAIRSGLD